MQYLDPVTAYLGKGYQVGEPLLNSEEIKWVRDGLQAEFSNKSYPHSIMLCEFNNELHTKIIGLVKDPQIQAFLASLEKKTGQVISILPGFEVTRNYFPHPWLLDGWHSDCGGELNQEYCIQRLKSKEYVFGKIAIYLQSNGDFGGSIDVIPKSHIGIRKFNKFIRRLANIRLNLYKKSHSINKHIFKFIPKGLINIFIGSKTLFPEIGAPVFFDSGLLHKGTSPSKRVANQLVFENHIYVKFTPDDKTKYAIYFQFGSKSGIESYLFDRLNRIRGNEEAFLWRSQIDFLSKVDVNIGKKMSNLIGDKLDKSNYYLN